VSRIDDYGVAMRKAIREADYRTIDLLLSEYSIGINDVGAEDASPLKLALGTGPLHACSISTQEGDLRRLVE